LTRFENLTYDDFRRLATDDSLSRHEKVGFPISYREGKEEAIFADITAKLPALLLPRRTVVDIGPGCSNLPQMLTDLCRRTQSSLLFVDSAEMLAQLPDEPFVRKFPGRFPAEARLDEYLGKIDVIIVYSVLHYVFADENVWAFLDSSLALLASGGSMLLGDIPNISKRKRFFSSEAGIAYHRSFTGGDTPPEVSFNTIESSKIDDAVVLSLLARARAQGFDAYVLPQPEGLPMANRREDVLVMRP
jgi:hypothetical protein